MAKRQTPRSNRSKPQKRKIAAKNASVATERIVMDQTLKSPSIEISSLDNLPHIQIETSDDELGTGLDISVNSAGNNTNGVYDPTLDEPKSVGQTTRKTVFLGNANERLPPLSAKEIDEMVHSISVPFDSNDKYYQFYSLFEVAKIFNVSKSTIEKWIEAGKLICFKDDRKNLRIPKEQIRNGVLAPGLEILVEYFSTPNSLWDYLIHYQYIRNERIRPLELHFQNRLKLARRNAQGFGMSFT